MPDYEIIRSRIKKRKPVVRDILPKRPPRRNLYRQAEQAPVNPQTCKLIVRFLQNDPVGLTLADIIEKALIHFDTTSPGKLYRSRHLIIQALDDLVQKQVVKCVHDWSGEYYVTTMKNEVTIIEEE